MICRNQLVNLFVAECYDLLISLDLATAKGTISGEASTVGSPNQLLHDGGGGHIYGIFKRN